MPSISVSKYEKLRTCPRLFYYEYVLFIERVKNDGARAFGSLIHDGQDAWWRLAGQGDAPWVDPDAPLVAALKSIGVGSNRVDSDKYEVAKAEAMMTAYHARYFELEFERVGEKGGVETYYRVPLRDPDGKVVSGWEQVGQQDALIHLAGRVRPSVGEHKSTSQDIKTGAAYWTVVAINPQAPAYIDAARASGVDVGDVLWDVLKKPDVTPELETPMEERELTQGKGCKTCGGRASKPITQGTGLVDGVRCSDCAGTGWKEAPKYYAWVNEKDEPVEDFRARVRDAIAKAPDAYFKQVHVERSDAEIAEARADLVTATVEIDAYLDRARRAASDASDAAARRCFPRNTQSCLHVYGRRCDFLDVCSGVVKDPTESTLYKLKARNKIGSRP